MPARMSDPSNSPAPADGGSQGDAEAPFRPMTWAIGMTTALVAMGAIAWFFLKDGPRPPSMMEQPEELPDPAAAAGPGQPPSAFAERPVDPAARYAGATPVVFDLSASGADRDPRFREFQVWGDGYVDDGVFGAAIASCRREHHPQLELGDSCALRQELQLVPSDDGGSEVVSATPLPADDASAGCRAWASCVAAAWTGRKGPALPSGAEALELTSETYAPRFPSSAVVGAGGADYAKLYADALERLEPNLVEREAFLATQIESGAWTEERIEKVRLEIARSKARIEDYRRMAKDLDVPG